jgi:hypothetical protein
MAAAATLRNALGMPVPPVEKTLVESARSAALVALGENAFAAAWAEGQAFSIEEAVSLAVAGTSTVIQGPNGDIA